MLDLRTTPEYREHPFHCIEVENGRRYVRVMAIHGANASGKSNLVSAMRTAKKIVVASLECVASQQQDVLNQSYVPYVFEPDNRTQPITFEWKFLIEGDEVTYGFSFCRTKIVAEWMYRKRQYTTRTAIIFERKESHVRFGLRIPKEIKAYGTTVSKTMLLLGFLGKLEPSVELIEQLRSTIEGSIFEDMSCYDDGQLIRAIDEDKHNLLKFLHVIDGRVQDVFYVTDGQAMKFYTKYCNDVVIPLARESTGMIRGLTLYILATQAIVLRRVMVIDALDVHLQPTIMNYLIRLFYQPSSMAQLIFTATHTPLMGKENFRRDQIYFTEKDSQGSTRLLPLSALKLHDDASFRQHYLVKMCGGIPST